MTPFTGELVSPAVGGGASTRRRGRLPNPSFAGDRRRFHGDGCGP